MTKYTAEELEKIKQACGTYNQKTGTYTLLFKFDGERIQYGKPDDMIYATEPVQGMSACESYLSVHPTDSQYYFTPEPEWFKYKIPVPEPEFDGSAVLNWLS